MAELFGSLYNSLKLPSTCTAMVSFHSYMFHELSLFGLALVVELILPSSHSPECPLSRYFQVLLVEICPWLDVKSTNITNFVKEGMSISITKRHTEPIEKYYT